MHIGGQFFLLNALCIPFDIRDYSSDKLKPSARVETALSNLPDEDRAEQKQVRSLPVVFGIAGSKIIGVVMVLIYFLLAGVVAFFGTGTQKMFVFASLLTSVYALLIILLSKEKRSNYFFAFLADGGLILQAVFFLICFRMID
jgi:4-hydroxybenzoate polyprenyltransferase